MLSDVVADEVSRLRRARGMNRDQLGDECTALGVVLSGSAIANIETGRRDPEGRRRREVTVDELVVLAKALRVPPVLLLFPLGTRDTVEVLLGRHVEVWQALQWFIGEAPFIDGHEVDHLDFEAWGAMGSLVILFRQHREHWADVQTSRYREMEARKAAGDAATESERKAFRQAAESEVRAAQAATAQLRALRRHLRSLDVAPPDLGGWAFLDEEPTR